MKLNLILNIILIVCSLDIIEIKAINRFVLNENNLQLNVISQHNNFFQRVFVSNHHRLTSYFPNGDEILDIICQKMTPDLNRGVPQVFVNSIRLNQTDRCFTCLEQKYFFNTSALIRNSMYEIECRLEIGIESVKAIFYKIYSDSLPRIRNGTHLYSLGNIVVHTLNPKQLSCEAVKDDSRTNLKNSFDSINWYDENNANLYFPFTIIKMSNLIQNFSALFDHTSNKVVPNKLYKCCTSFRGKLVRCQNVYVITNEVSTTSTTTTTTRNVRPAAAPEINEQIKKLLPSTSSTVSGCRIRLNDVFLVFSFTLLNSIIFLNQTLRINL